MLNLFSVNKVKTVRKMCAVLQNLRFFRLHILASETLHSPVASLSRIVLGMGTQSAHPTKTIKKITTHILQHDKFIANTTIRR